jgi:hypothetical protein
MIPVKETFFLVICRHGSFDDWLWHGTINQIFHNFSLIVEGIVMFEVKGLVFLFNWKEW